MLTNDAFRAMLSNQPVDADAAPAGQEEPEQQQQQQQQQRTADDLWAEAPTQLPVPFDGSHGIGLLNSCGCFDITAEHIDPCCDLVAQNPHADLWAESDEWKERNVAQTLGILRQSKTDSRRLRGDFVPLSLAKRVLDSTGWRDGIPDRAAACKRAVALAESSRLANTWQLGRAQARCCPLESACALSPRPVGVCALRHLPPPPLPPDRGTGGRRAARSADRV